MKHSEIVKALENLKPGAEWTLAGDDYADLIWLSEGNSPSLAEIESEIALLPAKEKAIVDKADTDKAAAEAKLAALGLTPDDLRALGL